MILGSFFPSKGAFRGRSLLSLLASLKWEESLPFVRPGRVAAISQLFLGVCGLWVLGWDFGLSWFLVYLYLLRLLEPECLVRTASKLLGFFTLQLRPRRKVTVLPQSSSGNISFTVFSSSFWPLCWLLSLPFFLFGFFELCSFVITVHLRFSCPRPTLPDLFLCLFCGVAQERNSDSLRSPSCIESQNHPVLSPLPLISIKLRICCFRKHFLFMSLESPSLVKPGLAIWQLIRVGIPVSLVTGSKLVLCCFPVAYPECYNAGPCLERDLRRRLLILVMRYWMWLPKCVLRTLGLPKTRSAVREIKMSFITTLMQYLPFFTLILSVYSGVFQRLNDVCWHHHSWLMKCVLLYSCVFWNV